MADPCAHLCLLSALPHQLFLLYFSILLLSLGDPPHPFLDGSWNSHHFLCSPSLLCPFSYPRPFVQFSDLSPPLSNQEFLGSSLTSWLPDPTPTSYILPLLHPSSYHPPLWALGSPGLQPQPQSISPPRTPLTSAWTR